MHHFLTLFYCLGNEIIRMEDDYGRNSSGSRISRIIIRFFFSDLVIFIPVSLQMENSGEQSFRFCMNKRMVNG